MAEEEGADDYVEGYTPARRPLDRLTTQKQLHELLKDVTENKVTIENEVAKEQDELQKLINRLSKVNDEYLKFTMQLRTIQDNQKVTLDNDKRKAVRTSMETTLQNFLERRPPIDAEVERPVHVYFLAGEECGGDLHIGREGAGSRDATFLVKLSQLVESLANQAAKYWGLDPKKVFFLDHQGRIVPGNMSLFNIILPPAPDEDKKKADDAAEGTASAPNVSSMGPPISSDNPGQLAIHGGDAIANANEQSDSPPETGWTLRGRDYVLTLVRAKTVIEQEDLSMPRGEAWEDFTFDAAALQKDLETTRAKRGDEDITQAQLGLDVIPTLYDLAKQGKKRKERKSKDIACRIVEFCFFLLMFGFFQWIVAPESSWTYTMHLIGKNVRYNMSAFTISEQETLGVSEFIEIRSKDQYNAWLDGPLQRAIMPGGIDAFNVHTLVVQGRTYKGTDFEPLELNWCPEPPEPEVIIVTEPNTGTTSTTTITTTTTTITTTTENSTLNATSDAGVSSSTCIPLSLKDCPTKGVVDVLQKGIELNHTVPGCDPMWAKPAMASWFENFASLDAFTFINGQVYSYIGGQKIILNHTNDTIWNTSLTEFKPSASSQAAAKLINVFVYQPSVEGLMVIQFLTEFSVSGPLINSVRERVLNFQAVETFEWVAYGICIFFSCIILIMELQRVCQWPQFLVFTDDPSAVKCSKWLVLFFLLPTFLCVSCAVRAYRNTLTLNISMLQSQDAVPTDDDTLQGPVPKFLGTFMPHEWTESQKTMYELQAMSWLDLYLLLLNLVNFICMVSLFFRFLLMYFPYFTYLARMVRQVGKPLSWVFIVLLMALSLFGVVFYVALSDHVMVFRNALSTALSTIQFAHGGVVDWTYWYRENGWTFLFTMWAGFCIFTMNLNHFTVAVLVSHKKEAELRRNYSSHPWWQVIHRNQYGKCKELNPALVGWDFTGKEPKEVTEWPGSK